MLILLGSALVASTLAISADSKSATYLLTSTHQARGSIPTIQHVDIGIGNVKCASVNCRHISRRHNLDIATDVRLINSTAYVANNFLYTRPTGCRNYENSDLPPTQILLVLQISVRGDKQFVSGLLRLGQHLTVLERAPTQFEGCGDLVVRQITAQWDGRTLIEKDTHLGRVQGLRDVLQYRAGLFAADSGEPLKKISELRSILQVLEQGGDGHPSTSKHPSSADSLRIAFDGSACRPIDHTGILEPQGRRRKLNVRIKFLGIGAA